MQFEIKDKRKVKLFVKSITSFCKYSSSFHMIIDSHKVSIPFVVLTLGLVKICPGAFL